MYCQKNLFLLLDGADKGKPFFEKIKVNRETKKKQK
jgi:hypothetical protein